MPCSRHQEEETLFCLLYVLLLVFCPFVSVFVNGFWVVDGEPFIRSCIFCFSCRIIFSWEGLYSSNSYAPMSHATPCGRLTPRWSVEISLIRQSLGGIRSMAVLPGSKACVWVGPLLSFSRGSIPRAEDVTCKRSVPCGWLGAKVVSCVFWMRL